MRFGSRDGSSSTVALYVNARIICGFILSWQGAPPQSFEYSVWDCVGFYTIHTFPNPSVENQFKSFLKLIISFFGINIILLYSLDSHSSPVRVGTLLFLFLLWCISSWGKKGILHHNWSIQVIQDDLGWPLHKEETLPPRTSNKKL